MEIAGLVQKSKPKAVHYTYWTAADAVGASAGKSRATKRTSNTDEVIDTQDILDQMAAQIAVYTEQVTLLGHEDDAAVAALCEIINLASELEELRIDDIEPDDAVLYD